MNDRHIRRSTRVVLTNIAPALLAMGLFLTSTSGRAQSIEEITITAPRVVHETIVAGRSPSTGAPIEETTISRVITFKDLDLTKSSGAEALRSRVRQTARDLCAELDKLYPFETRDPMCVRTSSDRAMVQAENAIAEAKRE